jgi:tRNA (guanine-N7-)-methyltransferase
VKGELPANLCLVRSDLVDYWRLLAEHRVRLSRHFLLYPNPWPKIGHLSRRWHGHAVFPVLPALGGIIECRSNWQIYVEEFAFALGRVLGREVPWASFIADEPVSPFERKYRDSGQALYRCVVDLDEQ